MLKSYKAYVTASCPYCQRLVQTLIDRKENFFVVYVDSMPELLKEKKEQYNHPTVPIVILREGDKETLIGGCTETLKHLNRQGE